MSRWPCRRWPKACREVRLVPVLDGLDAPIILVAPGDGKGRRFVGDQTGAAIVLDADGSTAPEPFLDLRENMTPLLQAFDERGLWSLTFHPNYARNGRLFVT